MGCRSKYISESLKLHFFVSPLGKRDDSLASKFCTRMHWGKTAKNSNQVSTWMQYKHAVQACFLLLAPMACSSCFLIESSTIPGWHHPHQDGSYHIHHKLRKCLIRLPTAWSYIDIISIEVPSSQRALTMSLSFFSPTLFLHPSLSLFSLLYLLYHSKNAKNSLKTEKNVVLKNEHF